METNESITHQEQSCPTLLLSYEEHVPIYVEIVQQGELNFPDASGKFKQKDPEERGVT